MSKLKSTLNIIVSTTTTVRQGQIVKAILCQKKQVYMSFRNLWQPTILHDNYRIYLSRHELHNYLTTQQKYVTETCRTFAYADKARLNIAKKLIMFR